MNPEALAVSGALRLPLLVTVFTRDTGCDSGAATREWEATATRPEYALICLEPTTVSTTTEVRLGVERKLRLWLFDARWSRWTLLVALHL